MTIDYEKKQADLVRQVTGWDDVKIVNPVIREMKSISLVPIGQIGWVVTFTTEDGSHLGVNIPFGLITAGDLGQVA